MLKFLLIAALSPALAAAQVSLEGTASIEGSAYVGSGQNTSSSIMGLTDWNATYAESTTVIDAMQFTYSQFLQKATITNPAADPCTVVYNGKFYMVGGYGATASTPLDYVQIYNPATDSWSQGATITTAEWGAGCALYNGSIYVFGGVDSSAETPTANAYVYNIAGDSWSTLTVLPTACADGVMAVTVGSYIYVMWEGNFWKFDPTGGGGSGSYTALTAAPSLGRVQWAATGYVNVSGDDRIYFLGGSTTSSSGYTAAVYYYSVTNSTWSGPQSTAPYAAHGLLQNAVYDGSIYYIAGFDGTLFYNTLYSYTPATDTWSSAIAAMNAFRDGVGGGILGNTLYVMGGRNAASSPFGMAVNESYQIGSTSVAQAFTGIRLHYTQASPTGSVRLGIYADAGASGPGALILDAGAATIANGWTAVSGLSQTLTLGDRYWLAFIQSASEGVDFTPGRPYNPASGVWSHCYATASYGALPSTFPSTGLDCTVDNSMYAEQLTR